MSDLQSSILADEMNMSGNVAPLVSVLMPCYNASQYLQEAIQSILDQDFQDFELLVVDDGSTDNSVALISEFAESDHRVRLVRNSENLGLIRTLNHGISLCRGEFIVRMDADDISELNRISVLIGEIRKYPEYDVISAGFKTIDPEGGLIKVVPALFHATDVLFFVSFFSTPIIHACMLARASVLRQHQFDLNYIHSEDFELFSRLLLKGFKIRNVTEPLYQIRMNPGSVSFKYEHIQRNTHFSISRRNISAYFGSCPEDAVLRVMVNKMNPGVTASELRKALSGFKKYLGIYLERTKPITADRKEILVFYDNQRLDMVVQAFKFARLKDRVYMCRYSFLLLTLLMRPHCLKYVLTKFRGKLKFAAGV